MKHAAIISLWNEQADGMNGWDTLGEDEKLEWAVSLEREAIAQMFEDAPALVQFAQNDQGGCLVCGFTPKLVIEAIRARGTT